MNIKKSVIFAAIFAVVIAVAGCGRPQVYGEAISNRNITPVKDILADPKAYDGKAVTISGKIVLECETGCWFNVQDGNAVIYTDLSPSGFAIPQNVGRNVIVEGKITVKDAKPTIVARGAEIK